MGARKNSGQPHVHTHTGKKSKTPRKSDIIIFPAGIHVDARKAGSQAGRKSVVVLRAFCGDGDVWGERQQGRHSHVSHVS